MKRRLMYFMICIFAAIGLTTVKSPLVFAAENTVFYDEEAADSGKNAQDAVDAIAEAVSATMAKEGK